MKQLIFCSVFMLVYTMVYAQLETINYNGIDRTYLMHIPDDLPVNQKVPLLIGLHPYSTTANNFQDLTGFNDIADQNGFIVIYPQGIGNSWNGGDCCGEAEVLDIDDVGFITELIYIMINQHSVDDNKVFATGFSNGGILCYRLASEIPNLISGIAPAGALYMMNTQVHSSYPVSIIHFHGLMDNIINFNGVGNYLSVPELLNEWREINNISALPDTFYHKDEVMGVLHSSENNKANIILITSSTAGHTWNISQNFNNAQLIWDFISTGRVTEHLPLAAPHVKMIRNAEYTFSPVPAHGEVILSIDPLCRGDLSLEFFNLAGQLSLKKEVPATTIIQNSITINIGLLDAGYYIVNIRNNKNHSTHSIIVN